MWLVARFYVCGEVLLWLKMYLHVRETVFNNEMKEPMMVTTQSYVKNSVAIFWLYVSAHELDRSACSMCS